MKIASQSILLGFVGASLFSGCFMNSHTQFSSGYSDVNFDNVAIGDDSNRVTVLLGFPLKIDVQQYSEIWTYSTNVSSKPLKHGFLFHEEAIGLGDVSVTFDQSGTVVSHYGKQSERATGKEKQYVLEKLGEPLKRTTNGALIIYHYSQSIRSESFEVRAILLNESGKVIRTLKFFYRD